MSSFHRHSSTVSQAFWGKSDREWSQSGLTLAEGMTLVERLLSSPLDPQHVWTTEEHAEHFLALVRDRCPVEILAKKDLERVAGFPFHRGVAAVARRPESRTLETFLAETPGPQRLAVAPRLTDPENLGALFRSAMGLGWDAVAVGSGSCDPYSRRCTKVSMGAVYRSVPVVLPVEASLTKQILTQAGWQSWAFALESEALELETWIHSAPGRRALSRPLAVWFGNEFDGLDSESRSVCEGSLVVPMEPGNDSLNVTVAAGIGLYRLRRDSDSGV